MDAARATMRAIRSDENRLLADRVEAGRSAVSRLQETAIAPGIGPLARWPGLSAPGA